MSEQTSPVPLLDLAPKLDRVLHLWNPLDYLRIVSWTFFFPQALTWYVATFGIATFSLSRNAGLFYRLADFIRKPTLQRSLFLQVLILVVGLPFLVAGVLSLLGARVNWTIVVSYTALNTALTLLYSLPWMLIAIPRVVIAGVVLAVLQSLMFCLVIVAGEPVAVPDTFLLFSIVIFMGTIVIYELYDTMHKRVRVGIAQTAAFSAQVFGLTGAIGVIATGLSEGLYAGLIALGLVISTGLLIAAYFTRFPGFLLTIFFATISSKGYYRWSRLTWLPIPGLQRRLTSWLQQHPYRGLVNVNEFLIFTRQFIPVVGAVNDWLASCPREVLLVVAELMTQATVDWEVVRFCSASLPKTLRDEFRDLSLLNPKRKNRDKTFGFRYDTPARAACAGFWGLHEVEMETAVRGFAVVRDLPGGEALHRSAEALQASGWWRRWSS